MHLVYWASGLFRLEHVHFLELLANAIGEAPFDESADLEVCVTLHSRLATLPSSSSPEVLSKNACQHVGWASTQTLLWSALVKRAMSAVHEGRSAVERTVVTPGEWVALFTKGMQELQKALELTTSRKPRGSLQVLLHTCLEILDILTFTPAFLRGSTIQSAEPGKENSYVVFIICVCSACSLDIAEVVDDRT